MSVQGIGPGGLPPWLRGPTESTRQPETAGAGEAGAGRAAETRAQRPSRPAQPAVDPSAAAPAGSLEAAPEGVDPELWSLLTTDERAHFARFQAMGGVTYGPKAARPSRPSVQGHRLDLRI